MESQTLYRKYRPKNFSEVIGQHHIVQTLTNAVKNNRLGQAYLFTGPRGTGKTSIARILAKTINCEHSKEAITCEKCKSCQLINDGRTLDIIEIDAASNTGVDNIRELKETVALPPTALKYKAYIIDEVHMLSAGAFNALLKTLEEPPAHVIFILATTEIHKVPETIISRCQRFDFARLPIGNIIEKLLLIAKTEKIKIDQDSLEMIALSAEGGMRDAESLLGQVIALEDKNITLKEVEEILGTTDRKFAFAMAEMIIENNSAGAIAKINALLRDGYDLAVSNKTLINYLRQLMLLKISPELKAHFSYELTGEQLQKMLAQTEKTDLPKIISTINLFLEAQSKISSFMLPQLPLEIAIIKATHTFPAIAQPESYNTQPSGNNQDTRNKEQKNSNNQFPISNKITASQNIKECHSGLDPEANDEPSQEHPAEILNSPPTGRQEVQDDNITNQKQILTYDVESNWHKLLDAIKPFNHSLQALLFSCKVVSVENNVITLATPYDFYKEKLNDQSNRVTVEDVFAKLLGAKVMLKIIVDKTVSPATKNEPTRLAGGSAHSAGEQDSLLNDAMAIMGGKIVEE